MAKEWVLNQAMNRWQLNFKKSVGPVAKLIRECEPESLKDWEEFYHRHSEGRSREAINQKGEQLYEKITTVLKQEIESITKEDCIKYISDVVIRRTYEGYLNEKEVIKDSVEARLSVKALEASDEWDRLYGVDYYFVINGFPIGLQIKPATFEQGPGEWKRKGFLAAQNQQFFEKYGARVFVIVSTGEGGNKTIVNPEIFEEIRKEIERLSGLPKGGLTALGYF
jgi:hypothetical protein